MSEKEVITFKTSMDQTQLIAEQMLETLKNTCLSVEAELTLIVRVPGTKFISVITNETIQDLLAGLESVSKVRPRGTIPKEVKRAPEKIQL